MDQVLKRQKTSTTTKSEPSRWTDLPVELSEKIMDNLYFVTDQVRFRAVCKSWCAAQPKKRVADVLPWLVKISHCQNNILECQIYEGLYPIPLDIGKMSFDQVLREDIIIPFVEVDITYKYGWVLFSVSEYYDCTNFLLYSVLSKRVITLPTLHHQKCSQFDLIEVFSEEPNSPNCVFIVFQSNNDMKYTISTLKYGENKWTIREFCRRHFHFYNSVSVYIRGTFYFVSPHGMVASYNTACGELKHLRDQYAGTSRKQRACELDGDLMVVYRDKEDLCFIKKFDFLRNVWVDDVRSLGDRTLFVSHNSFYVSTVGEFEEVARVNSVYWLTRSGWCIAYSLDDYGRYVKSREGPTIANSDTDGYGMFSLWLKPPEPVSSTKI